MVISVKKSLYFLIVIMAVFYPNHILISFLTSSTPLVVWKQLLIIVMCFWGFWFCLRAKISTDSMVFLASLFLLLPAVLTVLVSGISFLRVTYAFLLYFGTISIILVPRYLGVSNVKRLMFRLSHYLGFLLVIGLGVDYFTDFFINIPRGEYSSLDDSDDFGFVRRASLFFGAATTVFPTLAFCFLGSIFVIWRDNKFFQSMAAIVVFYVFYTTAILMTASKAAILSRLIFSALLYIFAFPHWTKRVIRNERGVGEKLFYGLVVIVSFSVLVWVLDWVIEFSKVLLDDSNPSNAKRFSRWSEGLQLFQFNMYLFAGHGVGATIANIPDSFPVHTHYESSFFQVLYEMGLFGLVFLYLPAAAALLRWVRVAGFSMSDTLLVIWIITYLISILSAPTFLSLHFSFLYYVSSGLLLGRTGKVYGTTISTRRSKGVLTGALE